MPTSSSSRIELRKERSVSEVLNVSFRFVRQNAAPLAKNLYLLAGPAAVLVGIMITGWLVSFTGMMEMSQGGAVSDDLAVDAVASMFAMIGGVGLLSAIMSFLIMGGTVAIVKRYAEHGPGPVSVSDVWQTLRPKVGALMLCALTYFALIFFPYVIAIIPCLGALAYMIWAFYAMPTFTMVYPMQMFETVGVIESFKRARRLVKGEFWSTLGVFFLAMVITTLLQGVITIPVAIIGGVTSSLGFDSGDPGTIFVVVYGAVYILSTLASVFLYSFVLIAVSFQYFNLVEKKEKAGLRERVEKMEQEAAAEKPAAEEFSGGPAPSTPDASATPDPESGKPGTPDDRSESEDAARRWGRSSAASTSGDGASRSESAEGASSGNPPPGNDSAGGEPSDANSSGNGSSATDASGNGASDDATESSRSSDRSS